MNFLCDENYIFFVTFIGREKSFIHRKKERQKKLTTTPHSRQQWLKNQACLEDIQPLEEFCVANAVFQLYLMLPVCATARGKVGSLRNYPCRRRHPGAISSARPLLLYSFSDLPRLLQSPQAAICRLNKKLQLSCAILQRGLKRLDIFTMEV
ncbi:unnamed protein product, partial [Vitis vinifera]